VEAGLLLLDVDYTSSRKALIAAQKFSPYELGFGKMVHLEKEYFVGRSQLERDHQNGVGRQLVGLELDWNDMEALYEELGLTPAAPSQTSRVHVPVYSGHRQIGRATSTTWSPVLKKLIALGSIETGQAKIGTRLQMEITVEAVRKKAAARVVKLPFFNPPRKTAVPV
jgi:aminomethyltransferase